MRSSPGVEEAPRQLPLRPQSEGQVLGDEHVRQAEFGSVQSDKIWWMNPLLKGLETMGLDTQTWTDADMVQEVSRRANDALEHARTWTRFSIGWLYISISREIEFLRVVINYKPTFNTHVESMCRKVIAMYHQLARAAK
ncbi:unnamed protein product [Euphydryas editha]|uniref:Uncharacterized protein n=1 Tax=Euphydryas editha TaxID=104508 RepID=A0AAU9VCE9_EUPED|nr:unnamed protein product [Euphydryas editha]